MRRISSKVSSLFAHWGSYIRGEESQELFEYSHFVEGTHTVREVTGPELIASFAMFDNLHHHLELNVLEKQVLEKTRGRECFICTRHNAPGRRYDVYFLDKVES